MTLPYNRKKTVAFDVQQIQQLLISTMKLRPAHLRLHAFALLLQLIPVHLLLPARAHIGLVGNPNPDGRFGV
jgi:hypothetical protein